MGVLCEKADAVAFCTHFQGPQMGPLVAVDPATLAALGVLRLEGTALGKLDGQALAPTPPRSGTKPRPARSGLRSSGRTRIHRQRPLPFPQGHRWPLRS